ncbi:MAG: glycoside hydrolase family 38 C-terminal domain-containing protein [Eubacteriales bacterium]|nr:glycoside hydrolase family 38 C-terminal domain-containing protein [Eubacteriales bacterium]
MKGMSAEWRDRVRHWIRTLKEDFYEPLGTLEWSGFTTTEQLSLEQARAGAFQKVPEGFTWGHTYEYGWFCSEVTLPERARGERIVLRLQPGGESSVFVNGEEFGTYRADWIRYEHHYFVDNTLCHCAQGGERYEIFMETYAGQYFPEAPTGGCATGPVLPGSYQDPLQEGARRTLGQCTYGIWDEDCYQLYMDVMALESLLEALDPASLRAVHVRRALEKFTLAVDFEQDKEARRRDYRQARELLQPALQEKGGDAVPRFYAVGNAHIDLAWLWPMGETFRKSERTFAAQLRLLEEYPEYKYLQSQPALYEMCRKYYPALFERIREAAEEGRWIPEGAMWVEPDTNMPSGEALVRQLLYGKKYFKEMFGKESRILWLPDTFGYSAVLPQLLKKSHVDYLVTQKIFWSYNEGDEFPYHYFTWRGMDGTEVTSFLPTSYTYETDPATLAKVWKERRQEDLEGFLIPFGYGDGGGGPTRDHIEYALRQKDMDGGVRVELAGPQEFFTDMEALGGPQETYCGELYFSAHRGTYTAQAMVKRRNRRSELLLREAEIWNALALWQSKAMQNSGTEPEARQSGTAVRENPQERDAAQGHAAVFAYPYERMEETWKKALLLQFHDILPGSGIARIYEEASAIFDEIEEAGTALLEEGKRALYQANAKPRGEEAGQRAESGETCAEYAENSAGYVETGAEQGVTFLNSLGFARTALVTLPQAYEAGAVTQEGEAVPVESDGNEVRALVTIPALGGVSLHPAGEVSVVSVGEESAASSGEGISSHAAAVPEGYLLENGEVRALLNDRGEIISFRLKEEQELEFADGAMNRLRLFKDVPRLFDAWDIDSNYELQELPGAEQVSVSVEKADGLVASLLVRGVIGQSAYTQRISLTAGSRRIEVAMEIDWRELHRLLKVAFPVRVYTQEALHEIQFGYVKRPTHRSRPYDKERFEVCNHRYTALCDASHGAAVLNDSKYGIGVLENCMNLSLLTASAAPEMRADNGVQRFTYGFTAWTGAFADCDVHRQGYELNLAPQQMAGEMPQFTGFTCDRENIVFDSMKLAEDQSGDLIVRLYETKNAACTAKVQMECFRDCRVWLCDLLEQPQEELEVCGCGASDAEMPSVRVPFHNFEVQTLRIARK